MGTVEVGSTVAGRFVVTARAASGGMANVYRGLDRETGQPVAIKVLAQGTEDEGGRFAREVNVLSSLRHPAVVRYIAHGASGDRQYLVMEWLDGETLRQRLVRGRLKLAEGVTLVRTLAEALAEAHAHGIVHRDVKPSNVLLPLDGDLGGSKLLDFGIAHLHGSTRVNTHTGMMLGTPGYMAPEQARGEPDIDARTDLFALGCVLHESVCGQPAFSGEHPMALLAKILFDEPPPMRQLRPDAPEGLESLARVMLAKNRDERPAGAREVVERLEALGALPEGDPGAARAPVITRGEQRLLSVVLAASQAPALDSKKDDDGDPTARVVYRLQRNVRSSVEEGAVAALRKAVGPYGGRLERLADG